MRRNTVKLPAIPIEATEPTVLLQPGTHVLTATDSRTGNSHQVTIHVESL